MEKTSIERSCSIALASTSNLVANGTSRSFYLFLFLPYTCRKEGADASNCWPPFSYPFFRFILRPLSKMKVAQTSCITSNSLYDNDVSRQETV